MKRSRSDESFAFRNPRKWRPSHFILVAAAVYILLVSLRSHHVSTSGGETVESGLDSDPPPEPVKNPLSWSGNLTVIETMAQDAWNLGAKAWEEIEKYQSDSLNLGQKKVESCPSENILNGKKLGVNEAEEVMLLPCGLKVGSSITVVGTPKNDDKKNMSQFMVELQGLKAVDGEDPPRILHFNPRLKGDWSNRPVIELNTCYRMQWGKPMRCEGFSSDWDDDAVDGYNKCERWERADTSDLKESKTTSWFSRFIGRAKKPAITWPFPFAEGKLFVMTLQARKEGYHIYVGGRHITSFLYRPGFILEDATGLAIKGNIEVHSAYATSLPTSHPSFSVHNVLEKSERWKSHPVLRGPVHLFIGILSATNHFAERMAVRKTWMQYPDIKSSYVVARFFVALSPRRGVNALLKKEAEYYGDIVILPFIDHYELVVLKTIAICEYGTRNVTAAYIMKCDDDTFVRLDVILREMDKLSNKNSLYIGNLNLRHRPLRNGKWAVTYEEWPEDIYPPYADGPGYIISNDIATFIASKHANQRLRIFKMEDVSMGMWVAEFNATSSAVQYTHSWKFCQYGCVENYYTAHYQSPRQMICLWGKLAMGQAQCCNF
ncbi:uncharacterized protein A4U43_C06F19030 [Asparagus officinalis]|uniref:Galectin domain-containing protein n=1 Tax=Asparagus officinalis TaxID=4686 RepID=A0A5P1ETE7_ASPOF|nr:hydroxyproline O-galactosyltransferase GALT2-like [Asparagus officinalis]ONK67330.1 uncharacterized protein A4U43_C06F19030 [Asparagus officinalis]